MQELQPTIADRAKSYDWTGLNIAGLIRLSFETTTKDQRASGTRKVAKYGTDINNRETQLQRIATKVERHGGTLIGWYDEPDTSAYKQQRVNLGDGTIGLRVIRPEFQRAMRELKQGVFSGTDQRLDMILVFDDDRLTRDPRELQDAIEAVKLSGRYITDTYGILDLSTIRGQQGAGFMNMARQAYSSSISTKGTDKHYERAQQGIPVGGNRPYGWKADKRTLEPVEAAYIMEAAREVQRGVFVKTIARRWKNAGVKTSLGNDWEGGSIRNILLSPRLCGYRPYQVAGKKRWEAYATDYKTGQPVIGQWETILSVEEWNKVVAAILTNKSPNTPEHGSGFKVKYLMSRFLICTGCGGGLTGQWNRRENRAVYGCKDPDCHARVSGPVKAIDALAEEYLFALLDGAEVAAEAVPWPKEAELSLAEGKVAELLSSYDAEEMPADFVFPRVKAKRQEIDKLKRERTAHLKAQPKTSTVDVQTQWPTLELEQKREILERVGLTAVLRKAPRACNKFDPARIEFVVS